MVTINQMNRINEYEWLIPAGLDGMGNIPVRLFATRKLLEAASKDRSLDQAVNAAHLPGLVDEVKVMPDVHQGYGFPIGGVAATRFSDGVISPGGIGYDINCGVRLLTSQITFEEAQPYLEDLVYAIKRQTPVGVGSKSGDKLSNRELYDVCGMGAEWAKKRGFATEMDVRHTESYGNLKHADPAKVSPRAMERGALQLGTLGGGNHFLEVGVVDQIFDEEAANVMGLQEGYLTMMIHSGSRGLGHQICSDYLKILQKAVHKYGIKIPDRQLACAPLDSPEGKDYLGAMQAAANYAFVNRQVMTYLVRQAFEDVFAGKISNWHLHLVYDITHNMGNVETHIINGKPEKVCVHRKGATRAFGPGSKLLPEEYRKIGQPVLVPGSMGTASWVLTGTEISMQRSLGSCSHGAGRVMSRSKAKKMIQGGKLQNDLLKQGILVKAQSLKGLAEEAPQAYKDVDEVIRAVSGSGIARKVARLLPVGVVKG